jgi:hypothetical protein
MCSFGLLPAIDKSGTSCYHLVTRLIKSAGMLEQVVAILLTSSTLSLDNLSPAW